MNRLAYASLCLVSLLFPVSTPSAATTKLSLLGVAEYVGTTPCGELARKFLQIGEAMPCDKITWQLRLSSDGGTNVYKLIATFGLQEQSAPGFVDGGTAVALDGKLEMVIGAKLKATIYEIRSEKSKRSLSFAMINDDLLHLLDRTNALMVGNEFWSYTLNRKGVGPDR